KENSLVWKAVFELLSRQWFGRLWIIQEVILSRNLYLACGKRRGHWDVFSSACLALDECGVGAWLDNKFHGNVFSRLLDLDAEKHEYQRDHTGDSWLFSRLVNTRRANSWKPKDKVYGLLGIVDAPWVKISYDDADYPKERLYHDIAAHLLEHNKVPLSSLLPAVDHEPEDGEGKAYRLPSWVADWSQHRVTKELGYKSSTANVFNASKHVRFKKMKLGVDYGLVDGEKRELRVPGRVFDTIACLSDVLKDPDLVHPADNKNWTGCIEFVADNLPTSPGDTSAFEAFCSVITAGKDGTGLHPLPPSSYEIISMLLDESSGKSPTLPGQTYSKRQQLPKGKGKLELASLSSREPRMTLQEIRTAMRRALKNRRLGLTKEGRLGLLGLFPRYAKVGDNVGVLAGAYTPFVLRETIEGKWQLIGEAYVHGVMHGERAEGLDDGDIVLV
ncbi:hypothetical protein QBC35DRAFT_555717, partial [Podospora australis]